MEERWNLAAHEELPDARDGLTRLERVILHELALAEREAHGRRVAAPLLYGRVVEHLNVSVAEFQRALARLVGRNARGDQKLGVTKPRAGRANR